MASRLDIGVCPKSSCVNVDWLLPTMGRAAFALTERLRFGNVFCWLAGGKALYVLTPFDDELDGIFAC